MRISFDLFLFFFLFWLCNRYCPRGQAGAHAELLASGWTQSMSSQKKNNTRENVSVWKNEWESRESLRNERKIEIFVVFGFWMRNTPNQKSLKKKKIWNFFPAPFSWITSVREFSGIVGLGAFAGVFTGVLLAGVVLLAVDGAVVLEVEGVMVRVGEGWTLGDEERRGVAGPGVNVLERREMGKWKRNGEERVGKVNEKGEKNNKCFSFSLSLSLSLVRTDSFFLSRAVFDPIDETESSGRISSLVGRAGKGVPHNSISFQERNKK